MTRRDRLCRPRGAGRREPLAWTAYRTACGYIAGGPEKATLLPGKHPGRKRRSHQLMTSGEPMPASGTGIRIAVLVKQVPDPGAERTLRGDHTVDCDAADNIINEMDEYAIEEALRLREAHGGEVTLLTMGPEQAAESIRRA